MCIKNTLAKGVYFQQGSLSGQVDAIVSKSVLHRLLIMRTLYGVELPEIDESAFCDDVCATQGVLSHYPYETAGIVDCCESGSTLRFLLPVIASRKETIEPIVVTGQGRLPDRPIRELVCTLRENGAHIVNDRLPLRVFGGLQAGAFEIRGDISSQFISGLLLALPRLAGRSRIELSTPLESAGYAQMTLNALRYFGVSNIPELVNFPEHFMDGVPQMQLEGDWSSAAVWLCAGAVGQYKVTVSGLMVACNQADAAIVDILRRFGAFIEVTGDCVSACGGALHGIELDISQTPDLLPVLAVVAANAAGRTRFYHAERLKYKESDRIHSTAEMLDALGIEVERTDDELIVQGGQIRGGKLKSYHDHRIIMAVAVSAVRSSAPVWIDSVDAVSKSYPCFFRDYRQLRGDVR